jgi:hypothetical protein
MRSMQDIFLKGLEGHGRYSLGHLGHHFRILTYLVLSVPAQSQSEEVEQVVQVNLPIPLSVNAQGLGAHQD